MLGITLIKTNNERQDLSQPVHTFRNWGLVPKTRFNVDPAEPKTMYVDMQGSDGIIDLTESLTGYVSYKMRTCSITFSIVGRRNAWSAIYSTIQNFIQGEKLKVFSDEDTGWFWIGRFQVSDWNSFQKTGELTISGNVEPYKLSTQEMNDLWTWDDFCFETDVIRNNVFHLRGDRPNVSVTVIGSKKHVVPVFYIDDSLSTGDGYIALIISGEERILTPYEEERFPDIVIGDGETTFSLHVVANSSPETNYTPVLTITYDVGSL